MERLVVPFDVKQLAEDGSFAGTAAVYETRDLNGDIIRKGAAKRSIQQNPEVPILDSHDPSKPIGVGVLTETDDGIEIRGQLELEVERARDARALMRRRAYRGLSIGYDTIRRTFVEDDAGEMTRILEEIRVAEVSPVTNPAQPTARITEVKAAVPFQDLPLASEDRSWGAGAAVGRVRTWADAADGPNAQYRKAFLWYDREAPENFGSYKFPIADVIDGTLKAVPRAIYAAAARLNQADIPEDDRARVQAHLERYYAKMGKESPFGSEKSKGLANHVRLIRRVFSFTELMRLDVKSGRLTEYIDDHLLEAAANSLLALRDDQQEKQESDRTTGDPDQFHSLTEKVAHAKSVLTNT